MVITGGSGGIATELIKRLAPTGMGIAVLDLQEPGEVVMACRWPSPSFHLYAAGTLTQ